MFSFSLISHAPRRHSCSTTDTTTLPPGWRPANRPGGEITVGPQPLVTIVEGSSCSACFWVIPYLSARPGRIVRPLHLDVVERPLDQRHVSTGSVSTVGRRACLFAAA